MQELDATPEKLIDYLTRPESDNACILDSCGVGNSRSNLLIAGISKSKPIEFSGPPQVSLSLLQEHLERQDHAAIFTISYDLGLKLQGLEPLLAAGYEEPDIFVRNFQNLLIHDYNMGRSFLCGDPSKFDEIEDEISRTVQRQQTHSTYSRQPAASSNFTKDEYLSAVRQVQDLIRAGETYQTNLTQRLCVSLDEFDSAANIFLRLRRDHPAAFAALIERIDSTVVSISPEHFIRVEDVPGGRRITSSPIKGTRPRGATLVKDTALRDELLTSEKDRAENTMIVDLMRNDLGRICEFGSVAVDSLCKIEEHPTIFHLVSSVSGTLRPDISYSDVVRAVFPCGSITGAPKLRTMEIINRLEPTPRGISMGAIGCRIPAGFLEREIFEMSVAIRTAVIRGSAAMFNVGGGIVIDSDPRSEYDESLLKARALLNAMNARFAAPISPSGN